MTAIELKSELYQQIDHLADSETLLAKVLDFVRRLNAPAPITAETPYTKEEAIARVSVSLEQINAGRVKTNEEVEQLLLEEFEWLK